MKKCKYCNKEFIHNHNREMYCSEDCRDLARKQQLEEAMDRYCKKRVSELEK